ncbi:MAG TPA: hypothetical protein VF783_24540, partial [Terriglobales bacterium]
MPFSTELAGIAGAPELYDWFGRWPQFHDAEVLSPHLNRTGSSVLTVHAWDMRDKVDSDGFYVFDRFKFRAAVEPPCNELKADSSQLGVKH